MNHCDPEGFRRELKEVRSEGKDKFFCWFDGAVGEDRTVDTAFEKAEDVFTRLMLPSAKKYIKNLNNKTSLDIGYGSGGQVLAASMYFEKAYGLDVHEEKDFVIEELIKHGGKAVDIKLLTGDGVSIPLEDETIDFIHSWATFLHIGTVDNTKGYLKESFRVMCPGGVAVIYFSRLIRSAKEQTWSEVQKDIKTEKDGPGYREGGPLTRVRGINIQMSMWYMKDLASTVGFEVLGETGSWDGQRRSRLFFGQYGIVLRKPAAKKSTSKSTGTSPKGSHSDSSKPRVTRRVDKNAV